MAVFIPIEQGEVGSKTLDGLPALCSVQAFARYLNMSDQTVRKLAREGEIPSIKLGRRVYIQTLELVKMLDEGSKDND